MLLTYASILVLLMPAARISAVLRRCGAGSGPSARKIREQGLELDPAARLVSVTGHGYKFE